MVKLPEDPTREMLDIMVGRNGISFEESFEIGKREQQKLGIDIVPPVCEWETAATAYRRLYEYLKAQAH